MIVLSLFDGMSCGQIALERSGIKVEKYYASEIDKYAIQITQKNYPNTIQLGDITKWKEWNIENPDLIIGGSPCQGFSFAGKQLNFEDDRSKLFFEFVSIKDYYNPKYYLLENVKMKIEYERTITQYMNCYSIGINSALVSAQNRRRLYWTNIGSKGTDLFGTVIPNIEQPKDKGILLKDILQPKNKIDEKYYIKNPKWLKHLEESYDIRKRMSKINGEKTLPLLARQYSSWRGQFVITNNYIQILNNNKTLGSQRDGIYYDNKKFCTLTNNETMMLENNNIRRLTPIECERLQTVPDNYTEGVSDNQRYKMLGNGWTIDVISHIFDYLKEES